MMWKAAADADADADANTDAVAGDNTRNCLGGPDSS